MNKNDIVNPIVAQNNSSASYFAHTVKGTIKQYNYIKEEVLKSDDKDVHKMFIHVYHSSSNNIRDNFWSPIPYSTIKKNVKYEAILYLESIGVLERTGYSDKQHECREYRIVPDINFKILNVSPSRVHLFTKDDNKVCNLFTGKAIKNKKVRHDIYNKTGKKIIVSNIVKQGMDPIEVNVIDYQNIEERLNYLWEQYILGNLNERKYLSYLNDERCYQGILMSGFVIDKEARNLLYYQPSYRGQKTGRRSEIGGGVQSCSREQKHEAYAYIPSIRNYDVKSSQIWGLYKQFKEANGCGAALDISVLDKYLNTDKAVLALKVGISVDCWKGILYGLFFGGFPTFTKEGKVPNWKKDYMYLKTEIIRKHICEELGIKTWYSNVHRRREWNANANAILRIRIILQLFYNQNRDLILELKKWHDYLATKYISDRASYHKGNVYITNKSDMKIELSQYMSSSKKLSAKGRRDLASHVLQGQEAAFISYLTWYSMTDKNCPYRVLSDQHDGLVVKGFIPDKYIEKARKESDFPYARLVLKSYR